MLASILRRLTIRRLMVVVAVLALAFTGLHSSSTPRPGLHWAARGVEFGICRNPGAARHVLPGGHVGAAPWQAGVWVARADGWLIAGVEIRDGKVEGRWGMRNQWVIW